MADPAEALQNRGPTVLAVTVAVWAIATAFVALRLLSRVGVVKKVTPDDYFIVLAWVSHNPLKSATVRTVC